MSNLRVREAANYVGLSKSSLDKFRCSGSGPVYSKVGRAVIYATADLDAWLAALRRTTTWTGTNDNTAANARAAA